MQTKHSTYHLLVAVQDATRISIPWFLSVQPNLAARCPWTANMANQTLANSTACACSILCRLFWAYLLLGLLSCQIRALDNVPAWGLFQQQVVQSHVAMSAHDEPSSPTPRLQDDARVRVRPIVQKKKRKEKKKKVTCIGTGLFWSIDAGTWPLTG